jgi:hypothetical protein
LTPPSRHELHCHPPTRQGEFERKISWLKKHGYLVNAPAMFYDEMQATLRELSQLAHHRAILNAPGYYRLGPTPTFRYSVIYQVMGTTIYLVAFAAPERRPGYWRRRKI